MPSQADVDGAIRRHGGRFAAAHCIGLRAKQIHRLHQYQQRSDVRLAGKDAHQRPAMLESEAVARALRGM